MTSVIYYSGFLLSAFLNIFGVRIEQNPAHTVLFAEGKYEIRQYAPMVVARTSVPGDYKHASSEGFRRLVGYITGDNIGKSKLSMTAPVTVQNQTDATKIAMTAPVTLQNKGNGWQMEFILPRGLTLESAPVPTNPEVTLSLKPMVTTASLRFSGVLSPDKAKAKTEELRLWLAQKGYTLRGEAYAAGYDSPFTPAFLRRNEVHIEIDPVKN